MQTIWEPQKERAKVDLRLPRDLHNQVHEMCDLLGIPKNAFFAMAAGLLLLELSPLQNNGKKDDTSKVAVKIVQKVLSAVRKQS
jgi:hypothetical protein